MDFFKKNKKAVIGTLAVVGIFLIYTFFFRPSTDPEVLQSDQTFSSPQVPGRDLIVILRRLEGIALDGSVFQSDAFRSLTDFSIPLVKEPIGRDNPFAPVGFEGVDAASTSVKTNAIESTGSLDEELEGLGDEFGI